MNEAVLLLILLNFAVIALITRLFFDKPDGRLGARWWLTSLPFHLSPAVLIAAYALPLTPTVTVHWGRWLALAAVLSSAASIALIFLTVGTHRIPLALFHQQNDAPQHIVTYGAYGRIRHPFYTAYIALFLATVLLFPHWLTVTLLVYITIGLTITAAGEEHRLGQSEFGEEYRQYIARTGRFVPRLRSPATTSAAARLT